MGPMTGTEGVHYEVIGKLSETGGKLRIVLGLTGVEAGVFQKQDLSRGQVGGSLLGLGTDAVGDLLHIDAQKLLERLNDGVESSVLAGLDDLSLGTAEVRGKNDIGALVQQKFGGGDNGTQSRVVGDGDIVLLGKRHVEIDTH